MEWLPSMTEPLHDLWNHSAFHLCLRLRHSIGCLPTSDPNSSIRLILLSGDPLELALQPGYQL